MLLDDNKSVKYHPTVILSHFSSLKDFLLLGDKDREIGKYKKLSTIHNFYCCNSDSIFPSTTFISLVLNCQAEQHQDKKKEELSYQNVFK